MRVHKGDRCGKEARMSDSSAGLFMASDKGINYTEVIMFLTQQKKAPTCDRMQKWRGVRQASLNLQAFTLEVCMHYFLSVCLLTTDETMTFASDMCYSVILKVLGNVVESVQEKRTMSCGMFSVLLFSSVCGRCLGCMSG